MTRIARFFFVFAGILSLVGCGVEASPKVEPISTRPAPTSEPWVIEQQALEGSCADVRFAQIEGDERYLYIHTQAQEGKPKEWQRLDFEQGILDIIQLDASLDPSRMVFLDHTDELRLVHLYSLPDQDFLYIELISLDEGEIDWVHGSAWADPITAEDVKDYPYSGGTIDPSFLAVGEFTITLPKSDITQVWQIDYDAQDRIFTVDLVQREAKTSYSVSADRSALMRCDGDHTKGMG